MQNNNYFFNHTKITLDKIFEKLKLYLKLGVNKYEKAK